jgi:regulator of extracellular matrix RemA (YlzA/DUF370 family)
MWLTIEDQGIIAVERIVTVAQVDAAPVRRLLDQIPASKIIVLTGGRKRQSALILDSGHIILTAWPVEKVHQALDEIGNGPTKMNIADG